MGLFGFKHEQNIEKILNKDISDEVKLEQLSQVIRKIQLDVEKAISRHDTNKIQELRETLERLQKHEHKLMIQVLQENARVLQFIKWTQKVRAE